MGPEPGMREPPPPDLAAGERDRAAAHLRKLVASTLLAQDGARAVGAAVLDAVVRQLVEEFVQERLLDSEAGLEALVGRVWTEFGRARVREHLPGSEEWAKFHLAVRADVTEMSRQPDFAGRLRELISSLLEARGGSLAPDIWSHAFALAVARGDAQAAEFVLGQLGRRVDRGIVRAWVRQVHRRGMRKGIDDAVARRLHEEGHLPLVREVLLEAIRDLQSQPHSEPSGDAIWAEEEEAIDDLAAAQDEGDLPEEQAYLDDDADSEEEEVAPGDSSGLLAGTDQLGDLADDEDFRADGAAAGPPERRKDVEEEATTASEESEVVLGTGVVAATRAVAEADIEAEKLQRRWEPGAAKDERSRSRQPLKRRRRVRSSSPGGGRKALDVRSRSREGRETRVVLRPAAGRLPDREVHQCEPSSQPYVSLDREGILVVYKPAFWTATTSEGWGESRASRTPGLLDWLRDNFGEKYQFLRDNPRAGLCHRLDVQTSGPLVVGTNEEVMEEMRENLRKHMWYKEYLALMHGAVPPKRCCGVLEYRLLTKPDYGGWRTEVHWRGDFAITRYKAVAVYRHRAVDSGSTQRYTLLRLHLVTGRTHQIRVHLQEFAKELGFPIQGIVGDYKYLPQSQLRADRRLCGRVFLHAHRLSIPPPGSAGGEPVRVNCPLPAELERVLDKLELDERTTRQLRASSTGAAS